MKTINTHIILRNDTSDVWVEKNPLLLEGELGIELNTNKIKIGDGITNWNDLPYTVSDIGGKSNIIVVNNFGDLPEEGETDLLYKINSTQIIYTWNNLTKMYEKLGQGSSSSGGEEGFIITL